MVRSLRPLSLAARSSRRSRSVALLGWEGSPRRLPAFCPEPSSRSGENCSETRSWKISSVLSPTHHDDPTRAGELSPPAAQSLSQQFLCGDRHQGTGTTRGKEKEGGNVRKNLAHLKIYIFCCALAGKPEVLRVVRNPAFLLEIGVCVDGRLQHFCWKSMSADGFLKLWFSG